jgi:hypothetical protein
MLFSYGGGRQRIDGKKKKLIAMAMQRYNAGHIA